MGSPDPSTWAIQAKAYDTATWITKRDVDTFLAESGRSEFSFRLLIATTNWIGRTAKHAPIWNQFCQVGRRKRAP
ncbi:MAG: hypothetical protein ACLQGN_29755 [Mycobacterium sp.]|uniref:restriction endonuclease n=1 Tax=Mycobacterium sp. TaxID=1785 RepID=UPI003F9A6795